MNKGLRDAVTEAVLRYAVIENHNREMAAIPSNEELAKTIVFSERHEKRMQKLFKKERRKDLLRKTGIVSKKIISVFLIIISVSFGALLTSPEVRAAVNHTIIEWYENFTLFRYAEINIKDDSLEWFPVYLPPGFDEVEDTSFAEINSMDIRSTDGSHIYFEYTVTEGFAVGIDNEHSEFETLFQSDVEYFVFRATSDEYRSKILWQKNGYRFLLQSFIDADELLTIAFSTEPK